MTGITKLLFNGTLLAGAVESIALVEILYSVKRHQEFWKRESTAFGSFSYLALGDSTAQGIGSFDPKRGYVYGIKSALEETLGLSVHCMNVSVSGATTKDVLINQMPNKQDVEKYDLVTLGIGGNDVLKTSIDEFERDFTNLLKVLPSHCYVSNLPYFGGRVRKPSKVEAMNKVIEDSVKGVGCNLVDLYRITKTMNSVLMYSADMFHPNARGYDLWHRAFWTEIRDGLVRHSRAV